ncbi:MAG: hypothetical protein M1835_007782 [Candelina submexicana]|nr:MAG: hypothetical protein M1835_007782 [Candelina submexicana]
MGTSRYHDVKRIAVIGAGPGGLTTAKYLLAEKAFDTIDIFEQRSAVGGVWVYHPETIGSLQKVPQTNPHVPAEVPSWRSRRASNVLGHQERREATFLSPMYDRLETNIPHFLMQYSDKPFSADTQLFPKLETVTQYLEEYADEVRHLIHFQTQILDVRLQSAEDRECWLVTTRDLESGQEIQASYDAVVVASGHHNVPYVPNIKGIAAWNDQYPKVISHSKFFKKPEQFANKKVIIIGNSASGLDISSQIGTVCKHPLLVSQRSVSYLSPGPEAYKEELPEIIEFILEDRSVRFANGRVEKDIDAVLFCTGYLYSFPFLSSLDPPLISDGTRTEHCYKHMFYINHPTLAFISLNQKIVPFPLSEAQAAVIARIWAGRLALPSKRIMQRWEEKVIEERGAGNRFHTLMFPLDVEYLDELHDWSQKGERRDGLENDGRGKIPPRWDEKNRWARGRFPAIKKAFAGRGEERHGVRSMEELGFDFEEWKRGNGGEKSLL